MKYQDLENMRYENIPWFNDDWIKKIDLTINAGQVPSTQNNFALLINSTFHSLIGRSLNELRFVKQDSIQLDYEIQSFNSLNGELIAWSKLPTISDSDVVSIYYDNPLAVDEQNPADVWDINYLGVFHMNESSGNIINSTVSLTDGIPFGSPVYKQPGQIGNAIRYNNGEKFSMGSALALTGDSPRSITVWATTDTFDIDDALFSTGNTGSNNRDFSLIPQNGFENWRVQLWGLGDIDMILPGSSSGFHKYTLEYDGDNVILYYDGNIILNEPRVLDTLIGEFILGFWRSVNFHTGIIDESRTSNIARGQDWEKTEYNNQFAPETFYSIGVEKNKPVPIVMRYK